MDILLFVGRGKLTTKGISLDLFLRSDNVFKLMTFIMLFILVFVLRWQAEDNVSKGKLRLAVEEYNAALALDPNHLAHNVHLHLGLCKVLVKLGRGKDAVTSCNEALNIDGDLIEALVQVCLFFLALISLALLL